MTLVRSGIAALAALSLASCTSWFYQPPALPAAEAAATPAETAAAPPAVPQAPAAAAAAASPPATPAEPATPPPAPVTARPALWKVSDADTTIWLFGTIHVLPDGTVWQNGAISEAVAAADSLQIETLIDQAHPETMAALLFRMGTTPGLPPIAERIASDKRAALERMIAESGVPAATFDRLETWTDAFLLVGVTLNHIGLQGGSGVEDRLQEQFRAAKKPIAGLETIEQQLGYFDTLPEDAQREFLGTLVEPPEKTRAEFAKMLAAWVAGDEAAIAASFDEEIEISPKLKQVLLVDRNARWTDWIVQRLQQPGKVFLAVGAGHLAGPESVVAMLRGRGLTVERVQ